MAWVGRDGEREGLGTVRGVRGEIDADRRQTGFQAGRQEDKPTEKEERASVNVCVLGVGRSVKEPELTYVCVSGGWGG